MRDHLGRASALLAIVTAAAALLGTAPRAEAATVARADRPSGTIGGERLASRGEIVPAGVRRPPKTKAAAYLVADADTGDVLAAKDPHGHYRPASTLKALTAITLIPKLDKKRVVRPSPEACNEEGSAVGLVPKPIYTVEDLFRALLMVSGNDAANALAEANGGMRKTLAEMNQVARRLQAYDTVAKTPSGLDRPGQRSSAYDLALIARAGLAMPGFRRYVSTKVAKFPAPKGHYEIANHNRLLGRYQGMIGVKNGWTSKALGSFVGAATRNGHTIIVVIMRHPGWFWDEVADLLDWGFAVRGKVTPVGTLVPPLSETPSPSPAPVQALPAAPAAPAVPPAAQAPAPAVRSSGERSPMAFAVPAAGGALALVGLLAAYRLRRARRTARE